MLPCLNAIAPSRDKSAFFKGNSYFRTVSSQPTDETRETLSMSEAVIQLIVSWTPFVLLIGTFVAFAWRGGVRARAPSGRTMIELYELQLGEQTRSADALERIAQALE